jgi:hypothetical protein
LTESEKVAARCAAAGVAIATTDAMMQLKIRMATPRFAERVKRITRYETGK